MVNSGSQKVRLSNGMYPVFENTTTTPKFSNINCSLTVGFIVPVQIWNDTQLKQLEYRKQYTVYGQLQSEGSCLITQA